MAATLEKALRAESEGPLAGLVRVVPLPGSMPSSLHPPSRDTWTQRNGCSG